MITFTLDPDEGDEYQVTATSRDVYMWEKVYRGKSLGQLKANLLMGDLYALAHLACKRQRQFAGTFDEFEESHDLKFETDDQQEVGPTPPAASPED